MPHTLLVAPAGLSIVAFLLVVPGAVYPPALVMVAAIALATCV